MQCNAFRLKCDAIRIKSRAIRNRNYITQSKNENLNTDFNADENVNAVLRAFSEANERKVSQGDVFKFSFLL
jgi:hypothetical protein